MDNLPPEVGAKLGQGNFATVYKAPGFPGMVYKKTNCYASIALLRALLEQPQPNFPVVHREVCVEESGEVWFLMEELVSVLRFDTDVTAVMNSMDDTYREAHTGNRESFPEERLSENCATRLKTAGMLNLAQAFRYLGLFLAEMNGAVLDIRVPNLMRNDQGFLVLSDPICGF
jgi:hypothetical protein